MRAIFGALLVSALDTTFLAQREPNATGTVYERNLPSQSAFLDKSHETIQHIRSDLKELFKTVGELRSADLDEVSRERQNYESQLHAQEEEVRREATANVKLEADNEAIVAEVHNLEEQKKSLLDENSQLEKKLKDLKGQVEQEVSGMEALLGSNAARETSALQASIIDKTDEESADDDKDSDDSKDDESDSDDDSDDKADKDDESDDDSDDDKDDDSDDDDDKAPKTSLAKTNSSADSEDAKDGDDDKDDDSDDDKDDDSDDDKEDASSALQVDGEKAEPCSCTTPCNKAAKPICFVESTSCGLKAQCDRGAKGGSCIKTDPVKGPWTFCSNLLNGTDAPKPKEQKFLPENPNVAVAMRMMSDIRREIAGITGEDEDGAERLRDSYKEEKQKEERKRKEVMAQQKELQQVQEEDIAKKAKLVDEVHSLQEKNKSLRQQVDRIGEFLRAESSKLSDAVATAHDA